MGGGLIQLVAFGSQDAFLTSNPQITYFKSVFRRYSPFAVESLAQTFNGTVGFGNEISCTISRNGDLINKMYLEIDVKKLTTSAYDASLNALEAVVDFLEGEHDGAVTISSADASGVVTAHTSALVNWAVILIDDHLNTNADVSDVEITFTTATEMISVTDSTGDVSYPHLKAAYATILEEYELNRAQWVNGLGHAIVESVEFQIGGQKIDKITSEWLDIRDQLMMKREKQLATDTLIGRDHVTIEAPPKGMLNEQKDHKLYVDLPFWFTQSPGMALPIIALQYHECKVNIKLRNSSGCVVGYPGTPSLDVKLWVDYVYLETSERRKMAQNSHEFLITQLQHTGAESVALKTGETSITQRLNLNHPVKELVWAFRRPGSGLFEYNDPSDQTDSFEGVMAQRDTMKECRLLLNGHDRFPAREGQYFRLVQPMMHHTSVPTKNVYSYSFALRPEQEQPSGTLNFSRIDSAQFKFVLNGSTESTAETCELLLFAVNYNVLRIMSGMGGLSFSN